MTLIRQGVKCLLGLVKGHSKLEMYFLVQKSSVSKFGLKALAEIFANELETTSSIKVFNFDPGATQTKMRASARPAEDPNTLKTPNELLKCYLWFFSEDSSESNNHYYKFDELSKKLNA